MRIPRVTMARITLASVLVVLLAACGGEAGEPSAGSSPSASTSAAVPGQTATPAPVPSPGTAAPSPAVRVVSFRLAYPWHWPDDVAMPGRVAHIHAVPRPASTCT